RSPTTWPGRGRSCASEAGSVPGDRRSARRRDRRGDRAAGRQRQLADGASRTRDSVTDADADVVTEALTHAGGEAAPREAAAARHRGREPRPELHPEPAHVRLLV